jgi:lipoyl synthase
MKPTRDRIHLQETTRPTRRPDWLRLPRAPEDQLAELRGMLRADGLHTVCEEAMCPNLGDCWKQGTATVLLLGDICTRTCGFCDVRHGRPGPLDADEPTRVAAIIGQLKLRHAVLTSVNRDDLPDGGAGIFAETIRRIHDQTPDCTVEVLIPDFKGSLDALQIVLKSEPEILNHNVETVPRLFHTVQPQDRHEWTRAILEGAKRIHPSQVTKTGLMVGLGETDAEVIDLMRDLRRWQVDILTIGQYLQPSRRHLPVERYYPPEDFERWKRIGMEELGFRWVESAPLVRSSYRAAEQARALGLRRGKAV